MSNEQALSNNSCPITFVLFGNYLAWLAPQQDQASEFGFTPDVEGLANLIDNYLYNDQYWANDVINNHDDLVDDYAHSQVSKRCIYITDVQQQKLDEHGIDKTAFLSWLSVQCQEHVGNYSMDTDDNRDAAHFNSAVFY